MRLNVEEPKEERTKLLLPATLAVLHAILRASVPRLTPLSCQINTTNVLIFTNNAVDTSLRGTLNGISMATASLTKAAGPPVFAVVFAWSINRPYPFPLDD